jgi:DNA-binding NarL/FixJ family response regulator
MKKIKIIALDDHPHILDAFRANIAHYPDLEIVGEGYCGDDLFPLMEEHEPDVLLLDQRMPQSANIDYHKKSFKPIPSLEKIKRQFPKTRIIIVSAWHIGFMVRSALEAGADGFFSKSDANDIGMGDIVREVMHSELFLSKSAAKAYLEDNAPQFGLTDRRIECIQLVADHTTATNAELSEMMGIAESTFNKHLTHVMKAVGTPKNRLATVTICRLMGIID